MATAKVEQRCPVCGTPNDVGVYVSGSKARCVKCRNQFTVNRPDMVPTRAAPPPARSPGLTQAPAAESEEIPTIPGYDVLEVIGRGGMGTVYRARQVSLSRIVAVKVLAREFSGDKDFIERFNREAAALARLSHPNIVPIIDKGNVGSTYYFVMDFIQGNTLRDILRTGKMSQDEVVKMSLQICRAMSFAHNQGVVHRDMKPENVLLDREKNVRIADFGLADVVGHTHCGTLTGSGMAMGTAHYMAPEQRKDAKRAGPRADIYSMGIMIYEMLTGEIPQGHFKCPSDLVKGLNLMFDRIVIKCVQPAPEDRYATAEDLARDLRVVGRPAARPFVPEAQPKSPLPPVQDQPAAEQKKEQAQPPQPFAPSPSYSEDTEHLPQKNPRIDVRQIPIRRKRIHKARVILFAAGVAVIAVAVVLIVRSCL